MSVLDSFSLAGKTAFVTGGSRGLGRAMAQALGEAGAAVALSATTLEAARRAARELQNSASTPTEFNSRSPIVPMSIGR